MIRELTYGLALALVCCAATANQTIYEDVVRDASDWVAKPTRIKLKKEGDLSLGRFAGVWGSVGDADKRDVFFLGKTAGQARLKVTLVAAPDIPAVTLKITGKDGQSIQTETLSPQQGETLEAWVRLKGKIQVEVTPSAQEKSFYALYVWYPGDRFDGLSSGEFDALRSGQAPGRPSFVRQLNQVAGEAK